MAAAVDYWSFTLIRRACTAVLIWLGSWAAVNATPANSLAENAPPPVSFVTGDLQEIATSESFQRLSCIMSKLGREFDVGKQSWRRARQELAQGRFDGIFPVMQWAAQPYSEFSSPIYLERWHFYSFDSETLSAQLSPEKKIGVIAGSLQEVWLRNIGHTNLMLGNNLNHLFKLLISKRVDELLLNEHTIELLQPKRLLELSLSKRFYRYVPVSVAFSRKFVQANSEFITAFNAQISACYQSRFSVPDNVRDELYSFLNQRAALWRDVPSVTRALQSHAAHYAGLSEMELAQIAEQWASDFNERTHLEQKRRLHADVSYQLLQAKENSQGFLNAIWILDRDGRLFASSDYFAMFDYSQSILFQKMQNLSANDYYIGDVMYSPTFMRSQVIAGIPLTDERGKRVGILAFAVDVESGLNRLNK